MRNRANHPPLSDLHGPCWDAFCRWAARNEGTHHTVTTVAPELRVTPERYAAQGTMIRNIRLGMKRATTKATQAGGNGEPARSVTFEVMAQMLQGCEAP